MKVQAPQPKVVARSGPGWKAVAAVGIVMFGIGWGWSALTHRSDAPPGVAPGDAPPGDVPTSDAPTSAPRPGDIAGARLSPVAPAPAVQPLAAIDAGSAPPEPALSPAEEQAQIDQIKEHARDQLTNNLENIRTAALSACWPDAPSGAAQLGFTYGVTFNKDGRETSRAIGEGSSEVPQEIRDCLRNYPVPLFHIDPPGRNNIEVDALISYP